jgi:hypothetical protein
MSTSAFRLADLDGVNPGASAGLMMREALSATSKSFSVLLLASRDLRFSGVPRTVGAATQTTGALQAAPAWFRLVRQGNKFPRL